MSIEILMSEKNLIVQHNKIIEAKYKLSIGEQRLIKVLVSMIEKDDEDFKIYKISIKHLSDLLGISDNDFYKRVENISKKLISNVLTFKNEDGRKLQVSWLSSADYIYKKGIVELEFSPKLKPFLLQLKSHFTSYELGNIINLKHTYSIRVYELLKQYEKIGHRKFSVSDFRDALALEDGEYKQFCDFRRWILKTAQKELAEKTDISFVWEEEKQGQKCVALKFIITSQKRLKVTDKKETDTHTQTIEQTDVQVNFDAIQQQAEETKAPDNKYIQKLIDMDVTRAVAVQLAEEFDGERIDRAIAYTKEKQKEGYVKNQAAFVVVAIQRSFVDPQAEERARGAEVLRLYEEREKLKKRWEEIKAQYEKWKAGAVELTLLEMTVEEIEQEKREFMESINGVMRSAIQKNKQSEKRHFLLYLRQKLPLDTLETWAQKNTVDLSVFSDEIRNQL